MGGQGRRAVSPPADVPACTSSPGSATSTCSVSPHARFARPGAPSLLHPLHRNPHLQRRLVAHMASGARHLQPLAPQRRNRFLHCGGLVRRHHHACTLCGEGVSRRQDESDGDGGAEDHHVGGWHGYVTSCARRLTMPRPMPAVDAVTTATLPSSRLRSGPNGGRSATVRRRRRRQRRR